MTPALKMMTVLCLGLLSSVTPAQADDIQVLSAMGMKSILEEAKPAFEQQTGHTLTIIYDTAGLVRQRVANGERPDVVFIPRHWMDALRDSGVLQNTSITDLATSPVGLVARAGTPSSDIATQEGLVSTLQAAESIGYTDPKTGGLSGSHFARLITDLGLAKEIEPKAVLGRPMARVSAGEIEYAVLQVSEILSLKNVVFIGPFPDALQERTPVSGSVLAASSVAPAAGAFLDYLQQPAATAIFLDKGMVPLTQPAQR